MFQRIYAIEYTKNIRQRMVWILIAAAAVIPALMVIVLATANQIGAIEVNPQRPNPTEIMSTWPGALINSIGAASAAGIGGMLVVILAGAAVTQEYTWRTLHLWLGRGVPRETYALARFASFLLPAALMPVAALLTGGLVSLAVTLLTKGSSGLQGVPVDVLVLSLLRAAYTLLPYTALAFLLGVASRSTVTTVGIGLAFTLLVENLLSQILMVMGGGTAQLVPYLPISMASSLITLNQAAVPALAAANEASLPMLEPVWAALGIAVYTILLLALAVFTLRRQDLTA